MIMCFGDSVNSCNFANQTIDFLFENTLRKWGRVDEDGTDLFYFEPTGSEYIEPFTLGTQCRGNREAKEQPVPVRPGFEISLWLELCG